MAEIRLVGWTDLHEVVVVLQYTIERYGILTLYDVGWPSIGYRFNDVIQVSEPIHILFSIPFPRED